MMKSVTALHEKTTSLHQLGQTAAAIFSSSSSTSSSSHLQIDLQHLSLSRFEVLPLLSTDLKSRSQGEGLEVWSKWQLSSPGSETVASRKMSSSHSSSSSFGSFSSSSVPSTDTAVNVEDDFNAPLWKYVTKVVRRAGGGGGNTKWQCNLCNVEFQGSYFRVKAHLLLIKNQGIRCCSFVSGKPEILDEIRKLDKEAENRQKMSQPKHVPLPPSTSQFENVSGFRLEGYEPSKKRKSGNTPLEKAMNVGARETLHAMIARMFYSAGLPFHLARNPYFVEAFQFAAENYIPGYVPPGYNLLRTTLLQKERANIERLLEPTKKTWNEKGLSICADGWSDAQRRPLINVMGASDCGAVFMRAVNCEGETKDKVFIAKLLGEAIHDVGPSNVVQVITDNAPVCSAAGAIVEGIYPKIFWTPCVVHTINLALKNICAPKVTGVASYAFDECIWIKHVIEDVMFVKIFIMNHSMRLAMFNEFVPLKLLSVADTRFASSIIMMKRFKLISRGLQAMVISDKWSSYREDDVGKAASVKEKVLSDIWWDKIDYILSFTLPIYEMLRYCDTDKPCLHLVYEMWDSMIEKVKATIYRHEGKLDNEESDFYKVVHQILVERWTKSTTPLHCLAHSLNPRYYSAMWLVENRIAPHMDEEISAMRMKCFQRYFPDQDERRAANIEYAKFSGCLESFGSSDSMVDRGAMEPIVWWLVHGASAPMLQSLAFKLLSQPCSSSCCERNWSTYSFIHSMRRNKMTPQRCEDLVFVHYNIRLLSRRTPKYTQGETKMWDIAGDAFDSMGGAGILEIADLSLDEPELEAVVFGDEADDVQVV